MDCLKGQDAPRVGLCLILVCTIHGSTFAGQLRYRFEGRLAEQIDWRDQFATAPPPIGPGRISGFFSIDLDAASFSQVYSPHLQVDGNGIPISDAHISMVAGFSDIFFREGEYRDHIVVAIGFANFRDIVFGAFSDRGFDVEDPGRVPPPPPIPAVDPSYGILLTLTGPQTWFGPYSDTLLGEWILDYEGARMWIDSSPYLDDGYGLYREIEFIQLVAVPEHSSGMLMAIGILALLKERKKPIT